MSIAIILDIILVGVIILSAIICVKKGFVAGIVSFIGSFAAFAVSLIASNKIAPILFDKFFKSGLIAKVASSIEEKGSYFLDELVAGIASFLPIDYVNNVLKQAVDSLNAESATLAQDIVASAFAPLFVPILSIILFFILFAILSIIVSQLSKLLMNINKIPLVGTLNQILGLASGVLCGLLQVTIILLAVWFFTILTNNGMPFVNNVELQNSMFYSTFIRFNPFF